MCVSNGDLKVVSPVGWLVSRRSRGEFGQEYQARGLVGSVLLPGERRERKELRVLEARKGGFDLAVGVSGGWGREGM